MIIDGQRAFPPEDCGGLPGYENCLRVCSISRQELREIEDDLDRDRACEERLSRRRWLGDWTPEEFDLDRTAKAMKRPVHYGGEA
jgi:hypothetical protein